MHVAALAAGFVLALTTSGPAAAGTGCPLGFTATPSATPGSVSFHWVGFGGADGYQVFGFQGQGDTAAYSPMLTGDAREATASNLTLGTYTFWVSAFHSGTVVASSCQANVTLGGGLAMACPTNLTASAGVSAIGLHWDAVANATGYRIARQAGNASWDDNYGNTTTTSFVDTNVTAGETYSYRVVTQNTRSPPEACASVTATMPGGAEVPFFPSTTSVALAIGAGAAAILIVAWRRHAR